MQKLEEKLKSACALKGKARVDSLLGITEVPTELERTEKIIQDVKRGLSVLVEDIHEDYGWSTMLDRFNDWRERYRDDYVATFAPLSLATLFEFYARLELIPHMDLSVRLLCLQYQNCD